MNRKTAWALAVGAITTAIVLGVAWLFFSSREDQKVVRVREIGRQLFSEKAEQLTEDQRRELRNKLREETKDLTEPQRNALAEDGRKSFENRIDQFFALAPPDRKAYLDAEIDRMESWRAKAKNRPPMNKAAGAGEQKASGGDGPRPGGPRPPMSSQQRQEWGRKMLDQTTPEQRAKFSEYFKQMNQRREERGLPSFGMFGRF